MAKTDKIKKRVLDVLEESFPNWDREEFAKETKFIDDLGADSLDLIELVMAVEDEFGIEIPDEAAAKVRTVGDLVALMDRLGAR